MFNRRITQRFSCFCADWRILGKEQSSTEVKLCTIWRLQRFKRITKSDGPNCCLKQTSSYSCQFYIYWSLRENCAQAFHILFVDKRIQSNGSKMWHWTGDLGFVSMYYILWIENTLKIRDKKTNILDWSCWLVLVDFIPLYLKILLFVIVFGFCV